MDDATSGREPAPTNPARPAAAILNYCQYLYCQYLAASRIVLSRFCYRRRKTLTPQGPRKLPKLDVAGSTPVARSRRNPVEEKGFLHDGSESSPASGRVPGRLLELADRADQHRRGRRRSASRSSRGSCPSAGRRRGASRRQQAASRSTCGGSCRRGAVGCGARGAPGATLGAGSSLHRSGCRRAS